MNKTEEKKEAKKMKMLSMCAWKNAIYTPLTTSIATDADMPATARAIKRDGVAFSHTDEFKFVTLEVF